MTKEVSSSGSDKTKGSAVQKTPQAVEPMKPSTSKNMDNLSSQFTIPKRRELFEASYSSNAEGVSEDYELPNPTINKLLNPGIYEKYSTVPPKVFNKIDRRGCTILQNTKNSLDLSTQLEQLVIASQTTATWAKHNSVMNCFIDFAQNEGIEVTWPFPIETVRAFTVWCLCYKNLKSSSVKSYISSIKMLHDLKGLHSHDFLKDRLVTLALKGAENLRALNSTDSTKRRVITLPTMLIIGHRLACSEWSKLSKQVFWCACTTSFFTAARMGELLAPREGSFDPKTTLLWENIFFNQNDEILIFLPHSKTKGPKGEFLDMFPFRDNVCCPVNSMKRLKQLHMDNGSYDPKKPVFMFASGKLLTVSKMNSILGNILGDIFEKSQNKISCHSFRAGIPSSIGQSPDKIFNEDIKNFGRWRGSSYSLYIRLEKNKREKLFNKVYSVLDELYK